MAARAKAKPKLTALVTVKETPALQAAELVTALLKHTRTRSLAHMYELIEATDPGVLTKLETIVLTEAQLILIEMNGNNVDFLRNLPTTSLSECGGCGKTSVIGSGAPSAKCSLTIGCTGRPTKSSAASKRLVEPGDAGVEPVLVVAAIENVVDEPEADVSSQKTPAEEPDSNVGVESDEGSTVNTSLTGVIPQQGVFDEEPPEDYEDPGEDPWND